MTSRDYLRQAYVIHQKIKALERHRADLRAGMYGIRSPSDMNPDVVQSSMSGDKYEKFIALIDDTDGKILKEIRRLRRKQYEIGCMISKVESVSGVILYRRHVMFETWEEIADGMGYSARHITRMYGQALKDFDAIYVLECPR